MIVIYHNPSSNDSNKCIEILETSKHNHHVIKYQDRPLDEEKLVKIIKLLKISPFQLIRKEDKLWIDKFKHLIDSGIEFSNEELINIMISHPELIERPIIINGEKAIIGKPPKKIFDILE